MSSLPHGVFRVNHPSALGGDGITQFGRALHALNIDIICANSSQAKGRVERAHKTLQDRLARSYGWPARAPWGEHPLPGVPGRLQHPLFQAARE
jgi:hypothetical protein